MLQTNDTYAYMVFTGFQLKIYGVGSKYFITSYAIIFAINYEKDTSNHDDSFVLTYLSLTQCAAVKKCWSEIRVAPHR